MRTYTLFLLMACTLAYSCKKDKKTITPTPVIPEPVVLVDTILFGYPMLYFSVERYYYINSQNQPDSDYHATYFPDVYDDSLRLKDLGGASFNGVTLIKSMHPQLVNWYIWPVQTQPIADGGTWSIPANEFAPAIKLNDPMRYPKILSFPDSIEKSTPFFTVRTDSTYDIELYVNYTEATTYPYNDYKSTFGDSLRAGLSLAIHDSIYITICARRHVSKYNYRANFTRRSYWGKWVYVTPE